MPSRQFTQLPEGITTMPPGPELAGMLASVDVVSLEPAAVPLFLVAEQRQSNYQCARRLLAMRECALADLSAPGGRRELLDQYAAEEPRAALNISLTAAWRDLHFVDDLVERVPRVLAAMLSGEVDEKRARTFVEYTEHLSQAHTEKLIDLLLGDAPQWPVAELRQRLDRNARALDPEWAARRERRRVRQQRLRAYLNDAGAANISLLDVPVATAFDRVSGIADVAAMCEASGHPGRLDRIHSDVALAMLDLEKRRLSLSEFVDVIVAEALARAEREVAEDAADEGAGPSAVADPGRPGAASSDDQDDQPGDKDDQPGDKDDQPGDKDDQPDDSDDQLSDSDDQLSDSDDQLSDSDDQLGGGDDQDTPDETGSEDLGDTGLDDLDDPAGGGGPGGGPSDSGDGSGLPRGSRRGQLRIKVALSTLMELDEKPATLDGWGTIGPVTARQLVAHHSRCRWEVAVAGPDGLLTAVLLTRDRPAHHPCRPDTGARADRGVIILLVDEATLDGLDAPESPDWTQVITDLQDQLARWRQARADDELAAQAEAEARDAESREAAAEEAATRSATGRTGTDLGRTGTDLVPTGADLVPTGADLVPTGADLVPAGVDLVPVGGQPWRPVPGDRSFWERPDTAAALRRAAERRRRIAWESLQRFPNAALVRWIQLRDLACSFPPCRVPAWRCDIDHTLDWAKQGLTVDHNLGPACGHDHAAKHLGGWTIEQIAPGHFVWISRTGNRYPSAPKPILPKLPDPDPPPERRGSSTEPDEYAADAPIWGNNPYPGPKPPRRPRGWAPDGTRDGQPPDVGRFPDRRGPESTEGAGPRPPPVEGIDEEGPIPF